VATLNNCSKDHGTANSSDLLLRVGYVGLSLSSLINEGTPGPPELYEDDSAAISKTLLLLLLLLLLACGFVAVAYQLLYAS